VIVGLLLSVDAASERFLAAADKAHSACPVNPVSFGNLAIHFYEHIAIDIAQGLHDPALCIGALYLIVIRRRFVRFDRHTDHKPFRYFALRERRAEHGNPGDQLFFPQSGEARLCLAPQILHIGALRHCVP
jgi:hypothetical protein